MEVMSINSFTLRKEHFIVKDRARSWQEESHISDISWRRNYVGDGSNKTRQIKNKKPCKTIINGNVTLVCALMIHEWCHFLCNIFSYTITNSRKICWAFLLYFLILSTYHWLLCCQGSIHKGQWKVNHEIHTSENNK